MKPSHALLAASLVANVALLTAFAFRPAGSSRSAPGPSTPAATPSVTSSATTKAATAATSHVNANGWGRLTTEDLPSLIARLRAAGFPTSVLRAIVNQRFELRREELTHDDLDVPYWKNPAPNARLDPQRVAELEKLKRERADTLKQLFGTEEDGSDDGEAAQVLRGRQYGSLPSEKISRIQEVQQRYGGRLSQFFGTPGGTVGPVAVEKIEALYQQQHAEIAQLLTPDELLEFDLRSSNAAAQLRATLTGFNPTEAEYRALFPLFQAYHDRFASGITSGEQSARSAAFQQMQEQIQALLPPDRYAEYLQASRPGQQQLNSLVTRLELPLSAAAQVIAVQQETQTRANFIRGDGKLSAADRAAQLTALSQEASAKITAAIGARGLEAYRQYGGQWLQSLAPRQSPKP